jgi:hypothetical protein
VFIFHFTKFDLYLKQSEATAVPEFENCDLAPSKLFDDLIPPAIIDPQNVIFI